MTWTVVANPAAGGGRTRRLLPDLRSAITAAAPDAHVEVSTSAEDARRLATTAAAAGHDLVACGGDGLVGLLAGVAADHERTLAIVPTGAGNDFASSLGYDPKRPLDALTVLVTGVDRVVDLGRVDDTWYAGVTCSGFDAEANRWANSVTRLRGTGLYVAATLRTLANYRPQPFRVTVDGEAHDLEAWMVSVGNNDRYAGGMRVTPAARLDDGLLDVCAIGPVSRWKFLRSIPKVFSGRHVEMPEVQTWQGREVTVEAPESRLPLEVWADGERVGPLPATMRAVPGALRVRVPRGAPGTSTGG